MNSEQKCIFFEMFDKIVCEFGSHHTDDGFEKADRLRQIHHWQDALQKPGFQNFLRNTYYRAAVTQGVHNFQQLLPLTSSSVRYSAFELSIRSIYHNI